MLHLGCAGITFRTAGLFEYALNNVIPKFHKTKKFQFDVDNVILLPSVIVG